MKSNIHFSPISLQDLDNIWEYIAVELCNINAAERTINNIIKSIDRLEEFPQSGTSLHSVTEVSNEYRFLVSGQYLVFYRTKFSDVFIDRILHSKRDYLKIIFGNNM